MISTQEMFKSFNSVSFSLNDVNSNNVDYVKKYSTESIGLEIGYYSHSKTDLYIKGIRRGRIIQKIPDVFSGFIYYFNERQLEIATRIVNNRPFEVTFLKYIENYCFGYTYALINGFIPMRCFVYEYKADRIVAFKSSNNYYNGTNKNTPPSIITDEQYVYGEDGLRAIVVKKSIYDFKSEIECFQSQTTYDHYNGKFWVPSI